MQGPREVRSLPGPVWTLALWSGLYLAVLIFGLVDGHGSVASAPWVTALPAAVLVAVLAWGARTPEWFLHVGVIALLTTAVVEMSSAGDAIDVLTTAGGLVVMVVYAGLWWHTWITFVYAAAGSAAMLIGLHLSHLESVVPEAWLRITVTLIGVAVGMNLVVARGERIATHDSLTGLMNRAGLEQYLQVNGTPGRATLPRTLMEVDLDGFKAVNDRGGHAEGDALLRSLTRAWKAVLRPDDVAIRFGGDEFVFVLPQTPADSVAPLIARMRAAHPAPWSYGVSDWPAGVSFDDALRAADEAMYRNKGRRTATD